MKTQLKKNLEEIDNLLEDNLNLMIEIDNIIDKNKIQLNNIEKSNINLEKNNKHSNIFLNRMSNFFYRIYTSLFGFNEMNNINENYYKENKIKSNILNSNNLNNSKLEIMKKKSTEIKNKLNEQNNLMNNIQNLQDKNDNEIKKNIIITNRI